MPDNEVRSDHMARELSGMATNLLSDKSILAALRKAATGCRPVTIKDGDGLTLIARPDGGGWWRLRYWVSSKENRLSLGTYPEVSLKAARQKRDEARKLIASGGDPSAKRKADKAELARQQEAQQLADAGLPGPGTFETVAREWLTVVHREKVSEGHAERTRIRFEKDAFPWIGRRSIAEIEAPELLDTLRRVIARGAIETAHRLKDACGQVFRYGIATGACKRNPAADLRDALPPVVTRHHAAIVDPKRAAELLRSMSDYAGHPVTRAALALSAMLFLRPGELRQLEWLWVDFDAATITIPPTLMKRKKAGKLNGAPHLVPLAPQAVAILWSLKKLTGEEGRRYVFPALTTSQRPMSENTVNMALRRLGYEKSEMTAHGFRAMARTMAEEKLGVAPEVIEAQLAHDVADSLGRAYNRTTFADQRRDLMLKWADYLDRLRDGAQVIELPKRVVQ
jgi:integrase